MSEVIRLLSILFVASLLSPVESQHDEDTGRFKPFPSHEQDLARGGIARFFLQLIRPTITITTTAFPTCYMALPSSTACSASTTVSTTYLFLGRENGLQKFVAMVRRNKTSVKDNEIDVDAVDDSLQSSLVRTDDEANGRFLSVLPNRFIFSTMNGIAKNYAVSLSTVTGLTQTLLVGCTQPGVALSPACATAKCTKDSECSSFYRSCVGGECKRCTANSDCSSTKPFCYTPSGKCSECIIPSDCDAATSVCDVTEGRCVQCNPSLWTVCSATGIYYVCDYTTFLCRQCTNNDDCKFYSSVFGTASICGADGACT